MERRKWVQKTMTKKDLRILIANYCKCTLDGLPLHTIYRVECENGMVYEVAPKTELYNRFQDGVLKCTDWNVLEIFGDEITDTKTFFTFLTAQYYMFFRATKHNIVKCYWTVRRV